MLKGTSELGTQIPGRGQPHHVDWSSDPAGLGSLFSWMTWIVSMLLTKSRWSPCPVLAVALEGETCPGKHFVRPIPCTWKGASLSLLLSTSWSHHPTRKTTDQTHCLFRSLLTTICYDFWNKPAVSPWTTLFPASPPDGISPTERPPASLPSLLSCPS